MPTDNALFAEAVAILKKFEISRNPETHAARVLLPSQKGDSLDRFIGHYAHLVDQYVSADREAISSGRPFASVTSGFLEASTVNAVAFKVTHNAIRGYFLALNLGTHLLAHQVCNRLLASRRVMPWVGDPGREQSESEIVERLIRPVSDDDPITWEESIEDSIRPRDPDRAEAVIFLLDLVLRFIALHEVRHVLAGHLDYLSAGKGRCALWEVGDPSPTIRS